MRTGPRTADIPLRCDFGKRAAALRQAIVVGFAGLVAGGFLSSAFAMPTAPSLKPKQGVVSTLVQPSELAALNRALEAADANRWSEVRSALARASDEGMKSLLRWRIVTDGNSGASFGELLDAMEEFKGWPAYSQIIEQAESACLTSRAPAEQKLAFLTAQEPRTSKGALALANVYTDLGRRDEAEAVVRQAWRSRPLSDGADRDLLSRFGGVLTADDYAARVDYLLWRGEVTDAQALLPRLPEGARLAAQARIALHKNQKSVDDLVERVPAEYASDPGLLYERARWRERRSLEQGELEMLLDIKGTDAAPAGREAIWQEKNQVIRRLIRLRDYRTAYKLTQDHGLSDGEAFRNAEWLAGWLALSKLKEPAAAERHFRKFLDGVSTPISVARGQYWLGEVLSAQNRSLEALAAYEAAAKYNYVFYGQLAAEKVASAKPEVRLFQLISLPLPTDEQRTAFSTRPDVRAAILLAELGRLSDFERFTFAVDDILETPIDHQMFSDIAHRFLQPKAAVRSAKAGLGRGLIAPDAVFPVLDLPRSTRNGSAEDAMVLALARQESEFNPLAISGANARGLMQIVPRWAQAEARSVGLPFRQSWLTDDPDYNLRLGRGFLDDLVNEFNGSYLLAAAAYNAGPSRVRQWMADFGDPRAPGVDPVDWIESIPFEETRNYVQRILENTIVYRNRLTGQPVEIKLSSDLKRGGQR